MNIGTVRLEEARVFDSESGFHRFLDEDTGEGHGSFEVFWEEGREEMAGGWYWWACLPGCLPDGEPAGPFASSIRAYFDAQEH